jgi:hypothetical protein
MARVVFTSHLRRHVACPESDVPAVTVGEALAAIFAEAPQVRDYVLDEQGHVRRHVHIYVDGRRIADRERLSDRVSPASEIFVLQALSGG